MPIPSILQMRELDALLAAKLPDRLAAVEAQLAAVPQPLKHRNARAVADGARLREAIGTILAAHPGPAKMSAKGVMRALELTDIGREELPSLRTVRWHIQQLRGNGNAAHCHQSD